MKPILFAILMGILATNLLAFIPQDPPLPDAVAFCSMTAKDEKAVCMCANMDMGGNACTRNDNNRPRMCKWQCGHAKSCGCCAS